MIKFWPLFVLLPAFFLSAHIIEVDSFDQILIPEDKNVLVIFDIDNTLIHLKQELGSDQWFYYRWKELEDRGLSNTEALKKVAFEFNGIQALSQSKLVEESILGFLQILRSKNIPFMGLTIRSFELAIRTHQQLNDCKVVFDSSFFDPDPYFLDKNNFVFSFKGVVFTNGSNKGKAFDLWKKHYGLSFDHVIVVDDKRAHLESLKNAVEKSGCKFTGYRYGFLDEQVRNFCPKKAQSQFNWIAPLIEGRIDEVVNKEKEVKLAE